MPGKGLLLILATGVGETLKAAYSIYPLSEVQNSIYCLFYIYYVVDIITDNRE